MPYLLSLVNLYLQKYRCQRSLLASFMHYYRYPDPHLHYLTSEMCFNEHDLAL